MISQTASTSSVSVASLTPLTGKTEAKFTSQTSRGKKRVRKVSGYTHYHPYHKRAPHALANRSITPAQIQTVMTRAVEHIGDEKQSPALGKGTYGTVHRVNTEGLGIKGNMVVKINRTLVSYSNAEKEAGMHLLFQHPNILPCIAYLPLTTSRKVFQLMPEMEQTLSDRLQTPKTGQAQLSFSKGLNILRDINAGLTYIHQQGYVHGDLTISNVMLDKEENASITDFGLTRLQGSPNQLRSLTDADSDTPYRFNCVNMEREVESGDLNLAPEFYFGKTLELTGDIFSVGFIFSCLLAGQKLPFAWTNLGTCRFVECDTHCEHFTRSAAGRQRLISYPQKQKDIIPRLQQRYPSESTEALSTAWELIKQCMQTNPRQRIASTAAIEKSIQQISQAVSG